jgi:hypothetical protein
LIRLAPDDLEPAERRMHELLASVPPRALPLGFREAVMRRVAGSGLIAWEWITAAVLALPSIAFLAHEVLTHGDDFAAALNNVVAAASAESADAFFFVDGATVLALALAGIASTVATHAAIVASARRAGAAR